MKPHTDPKASAARYDDGVPHHRPGEHDELHNEDVAHEHSDINVRAIIASGVILIVVGLISHVLVYFMFGWMERSAAANDPRVSPLAVGPTQMPARSESPVFNTGVTDAPQLLTNEPMALQRHRAEEAQQLETYGWTSQQAGVARVPIVEAKKLLVERGLPVREGAEPPVFAVRPWIRGESSGGRVITQPPPERTDQVPATAPAAQPHGSGH